MGGKEQVANNRSWELVLPPGQGLTGGQRALGSGPLKRGPSAPGLQPRPLFPALSLWLSKAPELDWFWRRRRAGPDWLLKVLPAFAGRSVVFACTLGTGVVFGNTKMMEKFGGKGEHLQNIVTEIHAFL